MRVEKLNLYLLSIISGMKKARVETNVHAKHYLIKVNKNFPNSDLPVIIYQRIFILPKQKNKAAEIVQRIFLKNGWSNSWRNGIYDFHHYHSNTHECMAVCSGTAEVLLGGPGRKKIKLKTGDVVILPAGTAHKCMSHSSDFFCVGAYPQGKQYDMNYGTPEELLRAKKRIAKTRIPAKDPALSTEGFLKMFWNKEKT